MQRLARASGGVSFASKAIADSPQPRARGPRFCPLGCWDHRSPGSVTPCPDSYLTRLPLAVLSALFPTSVEGQPRWPLLSFLVPLLRDCCGALCLLMYRR